MAFENENAPPELGLAGQQLTAQLLMVTQSIASK